MGIHLGMELRGHRVTLRPMVKETELFSKVAASFTLLPTMYVVPVSPDSHQYLLLFFFLTSHSNGLEVVPNFGFDLHFPID